MPPEQRIQLLEILQEKMKEVLKQSDKSTLKNGEWNPLSAVKVIINMVFFLFIYLQKGDLSRIIASTKQRLVFARARENQCDNLDDIFYLGYM